MFQPGTAEIIAGRSIANGFQGAGVGETLRFASRDWTVVGVFDAGRTGFDSEIWGDAEQMLQAFRRLGFSALVFKLADTDRFDAVEAGDRVRSATDAGGQARDALLCRSVGDAVEVHQLPRNSDLGHLLDRRGDRRHDHDVRERGLAHRRDRHAARARVSRGDRSWSRSWSRRCCSGLIGGVVGLVAASFMQAMSISTMNFQTFAELAFTFTLTPGIVVASLSFALAMGFVGGFLPAARAARMKIVDALRAA